LVLIYTNPSMAGAYWRVLSDEHSVQPWGAMWSNAAFTTNNAWVNVAWANYQSGGGMGSNSLGLTVPAVGLYRVTANMRADNAPNGTYTQMQTARFNHAGSLISALGISGKLSTGEAYYTHTVTTLTTMNALDYVILQCYSNAVGAVTWQNIGGGWGAMSMELVSWGTN
jgi:hypothetical protein